MSATEPATYDELHAEIKRLRALLAVVLDDFEDSDRRPGRRAQFDRYRELGGVSRPASSLDNAGVDRQTYEEPNCGRTGPHDQHFHSPIGGLMLNCPGAREG